MTLELLFENSYDPSFDHYEEDFQDLASYTFSLLNVKDHYSLEVDFVHQDEIHEINKEYRGIDRPTDVISFAFLDKVDGEVTIQGDVMQMLGEIIISIDQAKMQAEQYEHSLHREICFLFVHGLLHLLGYDHQTKEQEEEMFGLQNQILLEKGITR